MGNSNETYDQKKKSLELEKSNTNAKFGEFDQLFLRYDFDKDGLLNEEEFITLLEHYILLKPEQADKINEMKNEIKIDSDSALTQDEFRRLMYNCFESKEVSENIMEVFKIFDKNGEAELSTVEVMHVFNKLGLNITLEDVEQLFEEVLHTKNGCLDFEDFVKIMIAK